MNIFELWYKYSFIMSQWEKMNVSAIDALKVAFIWIIIVIISLFIIFLIAEIILHIKDKFKKRKEKKKCQEE